MIVVTGALGFIGSGLVEALNREGHVQDIIVVDDFYKDYKEPNLDKKWIREWIHRDIFLKWFRRSGSVVKMMYHLGARTDTIDTDTEIFDELNLNYSKEIWRICTDKGIPMIYASSAATYGNGEFGFSDSHDLPSKLAPLNAYAKSKNDFDKWVLSQKSSPPQWAGLKFFNVYGPNEYHKGRMASVVFHAFNQIRRTGEMKLFRSHKEGIADGHQSRDFIYLKDVLDMCLFFESNDVENGLYNIGTGKARSFLDLTNAVFSALDLPPKITFIDTPEDLRENYQYFTEAEIAKIRQAGYVQEPSSLEEGVKDYVQNYLQRKLRF